MRNLIRLIVLILLFSTHQGVACDVCNIFEYRPLSNSNYIGVLYHYRKFNGYNKLNQPNSFFSGGGQLHELDGSNLFFDKEKQDFELYQTLAVRINYQIFKNWNLLVILPYETMEIHYHKVWSTILPVSDTTMSVAGLGDVITAIDRNILIKTDSRQHIIRPGFAIKWATANAYRTDRQGVLFDPEIQTGTGSNDFILRLNYANMALEDGWGYAVAANYKWNTVGAQQYKFGDSWNVQYDLLYLLRTKNMLNTYIPRIGLYGEGAKRNTNNGELLNYTGGWASFLNVGFDFQFKNWSTQLLFQQPLYQARNGNQIGNAGRFNLVLLKSI